MKATGAPDATNLARKAGLNPATVWRLMTRERDTVSPRPETLRSIQKVSGVPLPDELAELLRDAGATAPPDAPGTGYLVQPNMVLTAGHAATVPVHAMLGTRIEGMYHMNLEPYERVRVLPGIANRQKVFAVRMPDDSMTPWRRPNELVFVDPTWTVAAGDHALVEINNGADANGPPVFMIRRFIGLDPRRNQIRLGRYGANGPEVDTLRRDHVPSMRRVLEWAEVTQG